MKEMRLRNIDGMEAANRCLPEFAADYNRRFGVAPREAEDAHRPVLHDAGELGLILSEHHARKLSKNLTFKFERREHQLTGQGKGRRLRGASVTVRKGFDGSVAVLRDGRRLPFRVLAEGEAAVPVADGKDVRQRVDEAVEAGRDGPKGRESLCRSSWSFSPTRTPPACYFSVRTGTVMQASKLSLMKWVFGVYLMSNGKVALSRKRALRILEALGATADREPAFADVGAFSPYLSGGKPDGRIRLTVNGCRYRVDAFAKRRQVIVREQSLSRGRVRWSLFQREAPHGEGLAAWKDVYLGGVGLGQFAELPHHRKVAAMINRLFD